MPAVEWLPRRLANVADVVLLHRAVVNGFEHSRRAYTLLATHDSTRTQLGLGVTVMTGDHFVSD